MTRVVAWLAIVVGLGVIVVKESGFDIRGFADLVPVVQRPELGTLVIVEQAEDRAPVVAVMVRSDWIDQRRSEGVVIAILDADTPESREKYGEATEGLDLPVAIAFDSAGRFVDQFEIPDNFDAFEQRLLKGVRYADSTE